MSRFQIIVLSIFAVFIIIGVVAFATYKSSNNNNNVSPVTIWGTFPGDIFNQYITTINSGISSPLSINYTQYNPSEFSQKFVSALARGKGPDAILITADMLLPQEDKIAVIPFSALPQRTFIDSYISEAQLYIAGNGIIALPFTIDPLVMYWNRDMFNTAGVASYPQFWDEFVDLNKKITQKDSNGNIHNSAIALGDFANVVNAREILGSLLLQLGNPITEIDKNNGLQSTLKSTYRVDPTPAISFFTQSVNPSNDNYSWNRGMPDSKTAFLGGTLATYFGFVSELSDIRAKNPNLNFDVAPLPILRKGGIKATYGQMYGFSILNSSPNINNAYQVISYITQPIYLASLSNTMYLPPVATSLLTQGSTDPYLTVFYKAALVSKSWIDADPEKSNAILANMIQSITSGKNTTYQALRDYSSQYDVLLHQAVAQ